MQALCSSPLDAWGCLYFYLMYTSDLRKMKVYDLRRKGSRQLTMIVFKETCTPGGRLDRSKDLLGMLQAYYCQPIRPFWERSQRDSIPEHNSKGPGHVHECLQGEEKILQEKTIFL